MKKLKTFENFEERTSAVDNIRQIGLGQSVDEYSDKNAGEKQAEIVNQLKTMAASGTFYGSISTPAVASIPQQNVEDNNIVAAANEVDVAPADEDLKKATQIEVESHMRKLSSFDALQDNGGIKRIVRFGEYN